MTDTLKLGWAVVEDEDGDAHVIPCLIDEDGSWELMEPHIVDINCTCYPEENDAEDSYCIVHNMIH